MSAEKWTPERRRERTRTALLDAAAEVFARRGFNGASLDEIAETAGYTRGAIYKHFDGKDDLFFAVNDRMNERALARYDELVGSDIRFDDVQAIVGLWREIYMRDEWMRALALEVRLYELRNEDARGRALAQRRRSAEMIADFMESRASAAGVEFVQPPMVLANIFMVMSDGFADAMAIDPDAGELFERFFELILPMVVREADGASVGDPTPVEPEGHAPG